MIAVKAVCEACGGTGLYQGRAERDGAFVVCYRCKGTGCQTITYEPFEARKREPRCRRVYLSGGGYCITDKDVTTEEGIKLPFSEAGVTYEEWQAGKKPDHIRFLTCPMRMDQGACHRRKGFVDRCQEIHGGWFSDISTCRGQAQKDRCWERFDSHPSSTELER